jgi:NADPH:quinone reductase-like Zn-dependent oxidoreductase
MWNIGERVMGIAGGGAHAEYLTVHEREAISVPAGLSWEEAAGVPEAFITAYDAMFRQLQLRMGERLLIHAVGSGVGTAAAQLASVAGVTTIGTSRSAEKLRKARDLGLNFAVDASTGDWVTRVAELTDGKGVDAVLDLVGGSYLQGSLRVLAPRGRLILVGLTAGRSAEVDLGVILNKRLSITGTVLRTRPPEEKMAVARDFESKVVPLFAEKRLRPVVERVFSFPDIRAAHQMMESDANFGKIVLKWD